MPIVGDVATTLLLRAFRLTTWRETACLLLGFPISIVAFVVLVVGLALGFSLLVTLVGVPILVLTAAGARALAWAEAPACARAR